MKTKSLTIEVADRILRLDIDGDDYYAFLKKEYREYRGRQPALHFVSVAKRNNSFEMKIGNGQIIRYGFGMDFSYDVAEFLLRQMVQIALIKHGIIFIHAAAVVFKRGGYAFAGVSGTGKSTILSLSGSSSIYAEDTAVISAKRSGFFLYPSPFDGAKVTAGSREPVLLKGILFLNQAKQNRLERLTVEQAYSLLTQTVDYYKTKQLIQYPHPMRYDIRGENVVGAAADRQMFGNITALYQKTKCGKLYFNKSINVYEYLVG